jgi:hypothetical protein
MADQPFPPGMTHPCGSGRRSAATSTSSFGRMRVLLGFSLLAGLQACGEIEGSAAGAVALDGMISAGW